MDDRLQKALDFSNYRITLFLQKENIKVKVDSLLTYAINGGIFKANIELITFVNLIKSQGHTSVVLIDKNNNPVEITDLETFQSDLLSRYFEATNFYYSEYTKLRKTRSVKENFDDIVSED